MFRNFQQKEIDIRQMSKTITKCKKFILLEHCEIHFCINNFNFFNKVVNHEVVKVFHCPFNGIKLLFRKTHFRGSFTQCKCIGDFQVRTIC